MDWTELSTLGPWWTGVERTPFYSVWAAALCVVLAMALVIAASVGLRLAHDTSALNLLKLKRRTAPDEPPTAGASYRGLVGQWIRVLVERERQGHAAGVSELDRLVTGRYDWAGSWFALCRSAALLVGLLFTFVGLAFTLDGLAEALSTSKEQDIVRTLAMVRASLPGLGTAFASSIAGVVVSLAIGLVDTALAAWRTSIAAGLGALSLEWLEPRLTPAKTEVAMVQVGKVVERTAALLATVAQSHEDMTASFREGAESMSELPVRMRALFVEVAEAFAAQHRASANDLRAMLSEARDAGADHLDRLDHATRSLDASAERLAERMAAVTHDLEVSGSHVTELAGAASYFREALDATRDIVERSVGDQHRMLAQVEETFRLVPQMTEAVTRSARSTEEATDKLNQVIGGEDMARYLQQLPQLTKLAETERESLEAMRSAASSLGGVGDEARKLEAHVAQMASTAEQLHGSYEAMVSQVSLLAREQMLPVLQQLVQETAGAVVTAWGRTYAEQMRHQSVQGQAQADRLADLARLQADLVTAVEELGRTHGELVGVMADVSSHLKKPFWQRSFGRGSM